MFQFLTPQRPFFSWCCVGSLRVNDNPTRWICSLCVPVRALSQKISIYFTGSLPLSPPPGTREVSSRHPQTTGVPWGVSSTAGSCCTCSNGQNRTPVSGMDPHHSERQQRATLNSFRRGSASCTSFGSSWDEPTAHRIANSLV